MRLQFDLMNARHVQGRKDTTKTYTVVEGIVTLPNGNRCFCEAFLNDRKVFEPGPHAMDLELSVNRDRRIEARVESIIPVVQQQAAKAA